MFVNIALNAYGAPQKGTYQYPGYCDILSKHCFVIFMISKDNVLISKKLLYLPIP